MTAIDNLQPLIYGINLVVYAIGTILFSVRFYCRILVPNLFGWDDMIAIVLLLGFTKLALTTAGKTISHLISTEIKIIHICT